MAVIGAGIIGMCCARWLQRDGHAVTVIDPVAPGQSTSFGNAGIISPTSVAPIAMPGTLARAPGWLLDPMGPLTIRWRYLPRVAPWLLRLLANTRPRRVREIAAALAVLNRPAIDDYEALLGRRDFADLVRRDGHLYVYESARAAAEAAESWRLRAEFGASVAHLGGDELRQMEPALGPSVAGAVHVADGAHVVSPVRVVATLAERFVEDGGNIVAARVQAITPAEGGATLRCEGRDIAADAVVVAAGAWSRRLSAPLGDRVPLETERGYHLTIADPGVMPRRPVSLPEGGFFVTPMEMGLRIAGTVEFAGLDAAPDYRRASAMLPRARRVFPGLRAEGASQWMGFRPTLPDSLPVIGPSPGHRWLHYAFGHSHLGLTEGATTGRMIADMIAGRAGAIDPTPYRVDRF